MLAELHSPALGARDRGPQILTGARARPATRSGSACLSGRVARVDEIADAVQQPLLSCRLQRDVAGVVEQQVPILGGASEEIVRTPPFALAMCQPQSIAKNAAKASARRACEIGRPKRSQSQPTYDKVQIRVQLGCIRPRLNVNGRVGTAYRTLRNPSHASQPYSPSTKKRRMIRKKLDG
jgi:hypothetical protein